MRRLIVLLAVGACHGQRAADSYFGSQVSPPGLLAQIRPEMTLAQVKAIAPDAKEDPAKGWLLATPASNVKLYAVVDRGLVVFTYADLVADDGMAQLTRAWGPPDKEPSRDAVYDHDIMWRSTATGWRAGVACSSGTDKDPQPTTCTIRFHPHLPLEGMFGKRVAPPGALANVTVRMPVAQLKAATHLAPVTDEQIQPLRRTLDYDGAVENLNIFDGRLLRLDYALPDVARPMIEKAWGPPTLVEGGRSIWFDEQTKWSASLAKDMVPHGVRLEFAAYQPFDVQLELLESIVSAPTIADAKSAHPELDWEEETTNGSTTTVVYLPTTELTDPVSRVTGSEEVPLFGGHAVNALVAHLDVARQDAILDKLTKKWGAPTKEARDDATAYHFGKHGVLTRRLDTLSLDLGADL